MSPKKEDYEQYKLRYQFMYVPPFYPSMSYSRQLTTDDYNKKTKINL